MKDDQIIAILLMLVDLKAENMALWKIARKADLAPLAWSPPELREAEAALSNLRSGIATLQGSALSQIPILLKTLSKTRLG
jgi:hypothetical protein